MLTKAAEIGKATQKSVVLLCFGKHNPSDLESMFCYGADKVYYYHCDSHTDLSALCSTVEEIVVNENVGLLLLPSSKQGKAISGILSARFDAGLVADCIEMETVGNDLRYYRAAINDSVVACIKCVGSPIEMCTVKENAFDSICVPIRPQGQLIERNLSMQNEYSDICSIINRYPNPVMDDAEFSNPNEFRIVFGIGRGCCNSDVVKRICAIASYIGAGVAGTRAVVETGLLPKNVQVGQSGISISPDLYICFGVSGASQHVVGIRKAKTVIAVNKDLNAPIFDYADYAVMDDLEGVLSAMEEIIFRG